jgi:hypothetical protein
MRPMSGRAFAITSRVVFFVCGAISLSTCAFYVLLRGIDLPVESEWIIFAVALAVIGIFSVAAAVLPRSWIGKLCRRSPDDERIFSTPIKLLGISAAIFYLVAVAAYLAPHSWNLNPQVVLPLCPMYFVKMNFDPSVVAVLFLLGPLNAGVYGSLGLTLGYAWLAVGRPPLR